MATPSSSCDPGPVAAGSAAHALEEKPKVLYVMGSGRCGSTILGITLGNCAEIFFAGELHLWLGKAGRSPLSGEERARFWGAVREQVTPTLNGPQARSLEQSTALFRLGQWRSRRRLRGAYRRVSEQLFRATAREAAATHVVDTSHFPRRARQLQALEGIELYLLFLVRDPQSVVASYSRDEAEFPRFNTVTTNIYLWLTYLLSLPVFLRHPRSRRLFVRHEAFVADPETVLQSILDFIGSSAAIPDLATLQTGLAFQGNPVLRTDVVALNRHAAKPQRGSLLTAVLSRPWTAIFTRLAPAVEPPSTPDAGTSSAPRD